MEDGATGVLQVFSFDGKPSSAQVENSFATRLLVPTLKRGNALWTLLRHVYGECALRGRLPKHPHFIPRLAWQDKGALGQRDAGASRYAFPRWSVGTSATSAIPHRSGFATRSPLATRSHAQAWERLMDAPASRVRGVRPERPLAQTSSFHPSSGVARQGGRSDNATPERHDMRSHAGAWERAQRAQYRIARVSPLVRRSLLVPTLKRGNALWTLLRPVSGECALRGRLPKHPHFIPRLAWQDKGGARTTRRRSVTICVPTLERGNERNERNTASLGFRHSFAARYSFPRSSVGTPYGRSCVPCPGSAP